MSQTLIEGKDYYYDEHGYMVLTERYHLEKGHCCGYGCRHCPYNMEAVPEPRRSELLKEQQKKSNKLQVQHSHKD